MVPESVERKVAYRPAGENAGGPVCIWSHAAMRRYAHVLV
jgi:hypothetical protein